MQRFLVNDIDFTQNIDIWDSEIYNQITRVLRSRVWDILIFFDGVNLLDHRYRLIEISKKSLRFEYIDAISKSRLNLNLSLYQALPNKYDKLELILQKWVEVWYSNFYFYRSSRSQKIDITDKKIDRFNKIIVEALEQSYRNIKPNIHFLDDIDISNIEWLNLYFHTKSKDSKILKDIDMLSRDINIFVWPEWWYSDSEINIFSKNKFTHIYLWEWILRAETTGIVVWFYLNQVFI